jgi:hypothetical protein
MSKGSSNGLDPSSSSYKALSKTLSAYKLDDKQKNFVISTLHSYEKSDKVARILIGYGTNSAPNLMIVSKSRDPYSLSKEATKSGDDEEPVKIKFVGSSNYLDEMSKLSQARILLEAETDESLERYRISLLEEELL